MPYTADSIRDSIRIRIVTPDSIRIHIRFERKRPIRRSLLCTRDLLQPLRGILIGKHILAKSQAKWLIVSYAPFALDFCPQLCRTRQISKITCVQQTETVANCCYANRQIDVSLLSTQLKIGKIWGSYGQEFSVLFFVLQCSYLYCFRDINTFTLICSRQLLCNMQRSSLSLHDGRYVATAAANGPVCSVHVNVPAALYTGCTCWV